MQITTNEPVTHINSAFKFPPLIQSQSSPPKHSFPAQHKLPNRQYRTTKEIANHNFFSIESDCLLQTTAFSIHLVNTFKQRVKTSSLIRRMYAARGYQTGSTSVFSNNPYQYTLEARQAQQLLGTLTLTIDSDNGLLADELYKKEIDALRKKGKKLCEVSKFAFTPNAGSKQIFAALFHIAFLHAYHLHGSKAALIEINPRHARFYKSTLGFTQIGEQRTCPRVDAPAILLSLEREYMQSQIALHAEANPEINAKSIYPHFLPPQIAHQVLNRIKYMHSATRFAPRKIFSHASHASEQRSVQQPAWSFTAT